MEKKMNNSSKSLAHIEGTGVLLTECMEEVKKAFGHLDTALDNFDKLFKDVEWVPSAMTQDVGSLSFNLSIAYNMLKRTIKKVEDYQEEMHIADMIDNYTENGF